MLCGFTAAAQSTAKPPLIVEKVNENQLVTLKGNTPAAANARNDLGRVSPNLKMTDLILVLRRSPEQQAAFDAFVASQYDPNSPNFHHWLEPDEVGTKFGPALADISTISNWLSTHGLSVDGVSKDRMTIRFSGSASQVETAFHTEIHNLTVKGEPHISNMTDPQIPMALDPVVAGPKALHNFVPRPMHRVGGKAKLNSETGRWERIPGTSPFDLAKFGAKAIPQPELGITGGGIAVEDITPYDFATIYNVLPLWNNSIDGTGQTIAIAGRSNIALADVASFRQLFGLPAKAPNIILNGTDPGACTGTTGNCTLNDQVENALDVEWSGAIAKNATIDLVLTPQTNTNDSIFDSSQYVVTNKTAPVLSVSYGLCELGMGTNNNTAYNNLWQTAASEDIAVFVATGDSGSPSCDQGQSSTTPYAAQFGLSVSGIASTPFDTAVGGTDFTWCNLAYNSSGALTGCSTLAPYWNASNSSTTGASATGYIPEVPWNDTCTTPEGIHFIQSVQALFGGSAVTDAETACTWMANNWQAIVNASPQNPNLSFFVNVEGTGGGASNCTTSDGSHPATCSGGYARPSWQTGVTGIPSGTTRLIPDVSFFSGAGLWNSAYIICVSAAGTCFSSTSPTSEPNGEEVGGTSAATPAMAAVMALINQKAGSPQGNPNSVLYQLAGQQTYANCKSESTGSTCLFNDVDAGTNAMACAPGSPNCTVSHTGDTVGVLNGFGATAGYDEATGLGTLNVANVVNAWPATVGTATATVTVTPASSSIAANQSLNVTVAVAGASGTPTGSVTLSSGSYTSASTALTSGSATITIPANSLTAGSDTLTANYAGDATYAAASGTASVTVTAPPTPTVTVAANPAAFNSGQGTTVTVTVAGASGTPTGTVTLTSGSFTSASHTLDGTGAATFSVSPDVLAVGTDTITASYGGDATYATASGTTSVTITQSTYTLAATTPAAITRGSSAASTITWTTTNNFSANVTLSSCTLNSGAPTNSAGDTPTCSVSSAAFAQSGSGTATVTTKAATTASLKRPAFPGKGLALGGSSAVLALMVFFGIPARRRGWRAMLGMMVLMLAFGSFSACGGGGGSSSGGGGGGSSDPGTASGQYKFTVNAAGADQAKTAESITFTVTVN